MATMAPSPLYPTLAIIGPTASGKSTLALALAEQLPLEIISMDSAKIYQGMDIGSAKPDQRARTQVPHHLVDIMTPLEHYSAVLFFKDCQRLVPQIIARRHIPCLVGGTMLYYHCMVYGMHVLPDTAPSLRQKMSSEAQQKGQSSLYQQLVQLDPHRAKNIHPHDTQRTQRALEIYYTSGQKMSVLLQGHRMVPFIRPISVALQPRNRDCLRKKIESRLHSMFNNHWLDEVRTLKEKYPLLNYNHSSMRCIGYRQIFQYLSEPSSLEDLRYQTQVATQQLAKRQLCRMRSIPCTVSLDPFVTINHLVRQVQRIIEPLTSVCVG